VKPIKDRPSFGFCALQYLLTWLRDEKHLHELMRGQGDKLDAGIEAALPYFQVARNFAGISKDDTKRQDIRRALMQADAFADDPERCVRELAGNLESTFDKNLISAASKLLWLRHRDPFIIYDSRAVAALAIDRYGGSFDKRSYPEYCERWRSAYATHRKDIKTAVAELGDLHGIVRQLVPEWSSKEVSGRWFAERVFDRYLWMSGRATR
jgi:hypothetical protein